MQGRWFVQKFRSADEREVRVVSDRSGNGMSRDTERGRERGGREADSRETLALITQDASPSILAVAFERLVARPVQAAWVLDAAIAERPFPSHAASSLLPFREEEATKG